MSSWIVCWWSWGLGDCRTGLHWRCSRRSWGSMWAVGRRSSHLPLGWSNRQGTVSQPGTAEYLKDYNRFVIQKTYRYNIMWSFQSASKWTTSYISWYMQIFTTLIHSSSMNTCASHSTLVVWARLIWLDPYAAKPFTSGREDLLAAIPKGCTDYQIPTANL